MKEVFVNRILIEKQESYECLVTDKKTGKAVVVTIRPAVPNDNKLSVKWYLPDPGQTCPTCSGKGTI